MNRFLTSCIMIAGGALAMNAEINFTAPQLPVTQYVEINADGINLREKPSTSSKKLAWECEPGTDACQYVFITKGNGCHPDLGEVFPYISEEGDWVQLYFCGYESIPNIVWTMKKFVNIIGEPAPLTAKEKEKLDIYDIPSMPGYALWIYQGPYDENELYIGRKVGDSYIFVYSVPIPDYQEGLEKPMEKYVSWDGTERIGYNKSLSCRKVHDGGDWIEEHGFNLSALSKAQIEWIFEDVCNGKPYSVFLVNKYGQFYFMPS